MARGSPLSLERQLQSRPLFAENPIRMLPLGCFWRDVSRAWFMDGASFSPDWLWSAFPGWRHRSIRFVVSLSNWATTMPPGRSPISGYAFYIAMLPHSLGTNVTLRLAVAPVYLDSEVGLGKALGENTDIGLGLAGGGFADSYSEIREGEYLRRESFLGHGGEIVERLPSFQPRRTHSSLRRPAGGSSLLGLRRRQQYRRYFDLPHDQTTLRLAKQRRRWGGRARLCWPNWRWNCPRGTKRELPD